jgi:hypothetical protein
MTCSGTLIDDDLVLTAVHCLVKRGPHGEFTREPLSPTDLTIELGGDYLPWGQVGVASIVSPTSAEDGLLCGEQGGEGDIAVLILPRKLVGVGVMVPSENPPAMKEVLEPIGFGHCAFTSASTTGSAEPSNETTRWSDGFAIRRRQRQGGAVNGTTSATFEMPASICPGDSGGPVHAAGSREIVGVVSLSAMDADTKTMNRSVMVRVDTYLPLIDRARHIADGTPPSELPPVACAR